MTGRSLLKHTNIHNVECYCVSETFQYIIFIATYHTDENTDVLMFLPKMPHLRSKESSFKKLYFSLYPHYHPSLVIRQESQDEGSFEKKKE